MQRYRTTILWLVAALVTARSFSAAAQSTNGVGTIDASTVRNIADRNIFDPNRTPRTSYSRRSTPPRAPDTFSLVGTMSYEKGDFAFFDGTSSEFHKVVQVDDTIGMFKVEVIEVDSVVLVNNTNEIALGIGDQMREEGAGNWVPASGNSGGGGGGGGSSYSRQGNNSGRMGRFSFRRYGTGGTRGNRDRGGDTNGGSGRRNNQTAPTATTPTPNAPAAENQDAATPPDDNGQPNVIFVPVDTSGQDTTGQQQDGGTATP